ncbi:uncharacterized protein LOC115875372 [Sitophilus oryzae]|uniref:Uncharacterized protein LOC115875372 n=1 Tax=Sitophilus oryzae TaxID=7048 RepID=A0A6J2X659_SITOR|nr:uncharacterized protein LOC115875372 [Sitophilus oryzae]
MPPRLVLLLIAADYKSGVRASDIASQIRKLPAPTSGIRHRRPRLTLPKQQVCADTKNRGEELEDCACGQFRVKRGEMMRCQAGKIGFSGCVFKVALVLAVVSCFQLVAGRNEIKKSRGTCLRYGHACWGAHGKRSGEEAQFARTNAATPTDAEDARTKWFLSKLISPLELRYYGPQDVGNSEGQIPAGERYGEVEKNEAKSINDWNNVPEIKTHGDDSIENLLQSARFLDKRSVRQ